MVNVGIVGLGYWGPNLVRQFTSLPGVDTVTCFDLRREQIDLIRQRHPNVRVADSFEQIARSPWIDAVCVATPANTHYALVKTLIDAGKHVLVEKPLTDSSAEAADLVDRAHRARRTLMVGHTVLYAPAADVVRKTLASGSIGTIMSVDARRENLGSFRTDVNVVWDLAPHDLALLYRMIGQRVVRVSATGEAHYRADVEDVAYLTLELASGAVAHLHVSWLSPIKSRRTTIVGSRGILVYDDAAETEKVRLFDAGIERVERNGLLGLPEERYVTRNNGVITLGVDPAEPLRIECADFVRCIETGARPTSDGQLGWEIVNVVEAANRSIRSGGVPVVVDSVPGDERPFAADPTNPVKSGAPTSPAWL